MWLYFGTLFKNIWVFWIWQSQWWDFFGTNSLAKPSTEEPYLLWQQQQSCTDLPGPHRSLCSCPPGRGWASSEPLLLQPPPRQRWTEQQPSPGEQWKSQPQGQQCSCTHCWAVATPYKLRPAGKHSLVCEFKAASLARCELSVCFDSSFTPSNIGIRKQVLWEKKKSIFLSLKHLPHVTVPSLFKQN